MAYTRYSYAVARKNDSKCYSNEMRRWLRYFGFQSHIQNRRTVQHGKTINHKVISEEPRGHRSRQRMDSPTACSSAQCPLQTTPNTQPPLRKAPFGYNGTPKFTPKTTLSPWTITTSIQYIYSRPTPLTNPNGIRI